jgi:hypothetical protein
MIFVSDCLKFIANGVRFDRFGRPEDASGLRPPGSTGTG